MYYQQPTPTSYQQDEYNQTFHQSATTATSEKPEDRDVSSEFRYNSLPPRLYAAPTNPYYRPFPPPPQQQPESPQPPPFQQPPTSASITYATATSASGRPLYIVFAPPASSFAPTLPGQSDEQQPLAYSQSSSYPLQQPQPLKPSKTSQQSIQTPSVASSQLPDKKLNSSTHQQQTTTPLQQQQHSNTDPPQQSKQHTNIEIQTDDNIEELTKAAEAAEPPKSNICSLQ